EARGGALYSIGALTATSCVIQNNTATGGKGFNAFNSNSFAGWVPGADGGAAFGGGVYVAYGSSSFTVCIVTGNTAKGGAGGTGGSGAAGGSSGLGVGGGLDFAP